MKYLMLVCVDESMPVPAGTQSTTLRPLSVDRMQPQPAGHSGSLIAVGSQLLVHSNAPGMTNE